MIPEILRGQKVKEFLTEFNDSARFFRDKFDTQVTLGIGDKNGNMLQIGDFYEQTFRPEMIEKYFGMEVAKTAYGFAVYGDTAIKMSERILVIYTLGETYRFPAPKILNDFIHDCLQAGLELIWEDK